MANGLQVLSKKELSKIVGKFILSSVESYEARSAIKKVAKEEFQREHGTTVRSWIDLADTMAEDTEASFACEVLNSLSLER
jgi:hypothetical protein